MKLKDLITEESTFVLWADRISGNVNKAKKKAKYIGKSNPAWNDTYEQNANDGYGTLFFVSAANVSSAKEKIQVSDLVQKSKNVFYIAESKLNETMSGMYLIKKYDAKAFAKIEKIKKQYPEHDITVRSNMNWKGRDGYTISVSGPSDAKLTKLIKKMQGS